MCLGLKQNFSVKFWDVDVIGYAGVICTWFRCLLLLINVVLQLCAGQVVLRPEHAVPVRSFAKEAAAPTTLKGDRKYFRMFFIDTFLIKKTIFAETTVILFADLVLFHLSCLCIRTQKI